jgi:NADH-ubiquinone oxidoreductase chain 5
LEIDIKKIIALSTLSQLGVIIMVLGAQEPNLAFFHLLRHAYFKAILFICAGILIHNIKDFQDIRRMGGVNTSIPSAFRVIIVANLRLCGLPFLRGFYSKDMILESLIIIDYGIFVFFFAIVATFLTVAYSCRLRFLLGGLNFIKEDLSSIDDYDFFILTGIYILIPFSIFGGILIS